MRPAIVRADQHVLSYAQIILDVGEAATVVPSSICSHGLDPLPTLSLPPVQENGYAFAVPERFFQGLA